MDNYYIAIAIVVMAVANYLTRALPFLFFNKTKPPRALLFLESIFPPVIMTILVFYSLKGTRFIAPLYGLYEFIAVVSVVILHMVFKNFLLSIIGSTLLYMALIQQWF